MSTWAPAHSCTLYTIYKQLKPVEQGFTVEEDCSVRGQVHYCGQINVLRVDLKESSDGFIWRERERSLHVEGSKTEHVPEPTVESLV